MRLLLLFITASLFLASLDTSGQAWRPHFIHITKENGLSSNRVNSIIQDQTGFMWIGTEEGLSRFDGNRFRTFRHDPQDQFTLSSNYVNCIFEDTVTKNLWVGTNEGLCYLNKTDYRFYRDRKLFAKSRYKTERTVLGFFIDSKRNKWIGTEDGLYIYYANSDTPVYYPDNTLLGSTVDCFFEDSKKNVWVGAAQNLLKYNPKTKLLERVNLLDKPVHVKSVSEDSLGHLWVATRNNGVFQIKKDSVVQFCRENNKLHSNKVFKIVEDEKGNMYFAVRDGQGLYWLDYKTGAITVYSPDVYDPYSINSNSLTALCKDRTGNIWIGTWIKGINFIDKTKKPFQHYHVNFKSDGLLNSNIRAVFQDSDGDIWIGNKEDGGLNKFDPKTGTFVHYTHNPNDPNSLNSNSVLSIDEAAPGILLIGTFEGGLDIFDKHTGKFRHNLPQPGNPKALYNSYVNVVFKDRYGVIWVASGNYIQHFDLKTGKFSSFNGYDRIRCIVDFSEDELYFGGNHGIAAYNRKTGKITTYSLKQINPRFHTGYYITGMVKDSYQNLWLTTNGGGLVYFNTKTKASVTLSEKDGLPGNVLCAVQTDNQGNLWISSTAGLSKYNIATKHFRNYNVFDGIQGLEFERGVSLKTKDGHMLFGGTNGFNFFHPDSIRDNTIVPNVVITDFKIFNKPVAVNEDGSPLLKHISVTREITLTYQQTVISFEFAALNFSSPENTRYAYKLEGLEKDWNYTGNLNPVANYSGLQAGSYVFKVKASNNDGLWNETPVTIYVKILPPPWKSWWAYLIYVSIVAGIIYLLFKYKDSKTQLHIAQIEKEKLEELHAIKLKFFTNISHEFKTPLTLIMGPVKKLMGMSGADDSMKQHLNYIRRNALRLQNLINQLMDLRGMENKSLVPAYEKADVAAFVNDLCSTFVPVAEEHHIHISFQPQTPNLVCCIDPDKTEKILFNLLSNAVKFTPENERILVSVEIANEHGKDVVRIQVTNTGSPIPKDQLAHLFDSFYHIDRPNALMQPGTGIGLAFTRELVELLGGKISVTSNDLETIFKVSLPYIDPELTQNSPPEQLNKSAGTFEYSRQYIANLKRENTNPVSGQSGKPFPSILIADDDADMRAFLAGAFQNDYNVTLASNGKDALDLALKTGAEVIISDIVMPGLTGIEMCSRIKTDIATSHIPVILLTAAGSAELKMSGMETGADVYIEKPFDIDFLQLQVKNLIQTREAVRKAFAKKITVEPENISITSTDEQFIKRAIAIVDENMGNPDFDVDEFVKAMNMSRTLLYQKIKVLTDLSVKEFIVNLRLKRAVQLLKSSGLTVAEIAFEVGFSSASYFGVCFKKAFKETPANYAEKLKDV